MNIVRNSDSPVSTILGGVDCVCIAVLKKLKQIIILANDVIITRSDGASDSTVTSSMTSSDCEPSTPIRSFITEEPADSVPPDEAADALPDVAADAAALPAALLSVANAVTLQSTPISATHTVKDTIKRINIRLLSINIFLSARPKAFVISTPCSSHQNFRYRYSRCHRFYEHPESSPRRHFHRRYFSFRAYFLYSWQVHR